MESRLRNEHAHVSLIGDREENQDRATVLIANGVSCLIVSDGMGGHEGGALAAQAAVESISDTFLQARLPLMDPLGFLNLALGRAHMAVVAIGMTLPIAERPRATCAVCIVQHGSAYWAHVGDSRVYHLRGGDVIARTRDHSHVEDLVRKGRITTYEARRHPLRNFVEYCLGGTEELTEMTIGRRRALEPGDVLLLCTDGVWGMFDDEAIGHPFRGGAPTDDAVRWLCQTAVTNAAPYSDNSTAAAMLWLG
jgi:serine/threonine protein phosphatase PrpC